MLTNRLILEARHFDPKLHQRFENLEILFGKDGLADETVKERLVWLEKGRVVMCVLYMSFQCYSHLLLTDLSNQNLNLIHVEVIVIIVINVSGDHTSVCSK